MITVTKNNLYGKGRWVIVVIAFQAKLRPFARNTLLTYSTNTMCNLSDVQVY